MMSRAIVALGLIASAAAQSTFVGTRRDSADLVQMNDTSIEQYSWAQTAQNRVAQVEKLTAVTTDGVKLAAPVISRVDALVQEVAGLKVNMKKRINRVHTTMATGGDASVIMEASKQIYNAALGLEQDTQTTRRSLVKNVGAQIEPIEKATSDAQAAVNDAFNELEAMVDDSIARAVESAPFYGSDKHIEQVTGIKIDEWSDYWDGKPVKSKGTVSNVAGRMYYKVKFNLHTPGWFSGNQDELTWACRALSIHLRRKDGKERDLRPVCNHYSRHGLYGGQGSCAYVDKSYFSHCGGDGYWRMEEACGGAPEEWLRNSVFWEDHHDNEDHILRHDGVNRHSHVGPYSARQNSATTICTSANDNYKV